jgi:hypothetical protein
MTDAEKIELLRAKLEETLGENDKLRALVERLTEGASAHDTLSELHRNRDLPAAIRAKAAIGCLGVESAPLKSVEPPLELTAEVIEPLSVVVERQRMRARAIQALPLEVREQMVRGVVRRDGNGDDSSSND